MSDNFLRIIPTDPTWAPDGAAAEKARRLLSSFVPQADQVTLNLQDEVGFVDQGSNFEGVGCPLCKAGIDVDWWQGAMDRAFDTQFRDLSVSPPCCATPTSLNDLLYEWPAGFARFTLEAMNPQRDRNLDPEQVQKLEGALGCRIRQIWAHY